MHEFHGDAIPPDATLSHRWGLDEILFQEMLNGVTENQKHSNGYRKVLAFCETARANRLAWGRVDTYTIDKSSSSELSEVINSMYSWYSRAAVCYAYLSDVEEVSDNGDTVLQLRKSAWFGRGWTLQELLAPAQLIFFDSHWNDISTKRSLQSDIPEVTRIARQYLRGTSPADEDRPSVAEILSWASGRLTTRKEDEAYCLMGLFGVNVRSFMSKHCNDTPTHLSRCLSFYGEGFKAFMRLQLEIIKHSEDESIFAWGVKTSIDKGLLALSPAAFADSGSVRKRDYDLERQPFTMTNRELRMKPMVLESMVLESGAIAMRRRYTTLLNCERPSLPQPGQYVQLGIALVRRSGDLLERSHLSSLLPISDVYSTFDIQQAQRQTLYVHQPGLPGTMGFGRPRLSMRLKYVEWDDRSVTSQGFRTETID